jgi:hypothetical protein
MGRGWIRGSAIGPCHLKRGELVVLHIVADPRNRMKRLATKGWRLAPQEAEAVSGIPMRGYHLALLAGIIPMATLIAVALSRRGFAGGSSNS